MKKTIIGVIAILFVIGGLFLASAITKRTAEPVQPTCGADGCNGQCAGNCGNPDCQCAKSGVDSAATCGSGACNGNCGGSCGAKTCGCQKA